PENTLFFLAQGGNVSHFSYFRNGNTAQALTDALTLDQPPNLLPVGPRSLAGKDSSGFRASASDPQRAAVFLLPGILGSNLKQDRERIWASWRVVNGLEHLAFHENDASIQPDGPLSYYYDDLARYLSETHEVIPFAFDWRLPIEQEADRFA